MSRITGKDALGLFEAYQAVYAPRQLTEEQIWEEVENWVNSLLEEGYDLGDYTWEDMYNAYIDEDRAPGVKPYKPGPTQADVRADAAAARQRQMASSQGQTGYGPDEKFKDWKLTSTPSTVSRTGQTVSQRMDAEKPYATRPFAPLFSKQGSRTASAVTRATEGPGEPQSVTMPRMRSKPSREVVRRSPQSEAYDLYNLVLSHLLDEGYADTYEAAEKIMVNMSEEWIDDIVEASTIVAAPSPGDRRRPVNKPYNDKIAKQNPIRNKPVTDKTKKEYPMQYKEGYVGEAAYVPPNIPAVPAEVRTSTAKKPAPPSVKPTSSKKTEKRGGLGIMGPVAVWSAYKLGQEAARRPKSLLNPLGYTNEEVDVYDIILSHLLDEGYADTLKAAEVMMVNMSEDWIDSILDEGYVDYRKGKLPSGRTPQQALTGSQTRSEIRSRQFDRASRDTFGRVNNYSDAERSAHRATSQKFADRAAHQAKVGREMEKGTAGNPLSYAGKRYTGDTLSGGEPNTSRHSRARENRKDPERARKIRAAVKRWDAGTP